MESSAQTIERLERELTDAREARDYRIAEAAKARGALVLAKDRFEVLRAAAQALRDTFPASTPWSPEEVRLADALKGAPAPEQPASVERPASLREVWAAIEGLRESLEAAWEVIEKLGGAELVARLLRERDARKAGG